MKHKQIETFYWAARLGSFAKAASRLNATQSAISMRVQELEADLGLVLFDRTQRSAKMTSQGAALLPLAQQILDATERLAKVAADHVAVSGYVRVGVTEVVAMTWLPDLVGRLRQSHPAIQLEIEVALSHVLEEMLLRGALDMIIAASEMNSSEFSSRELGSIQFVWVADPAAEGLPDVLTPATMALAPIISTSREWQFRGSTLSWLTTNEVRFRRITICNTFRTAASLAMSGLGIAYVPECLYMSEFSSGLLKTISCWPPIRPLTMFVIAPLSGFVPARSAVESAAALAAAQHSCWIAPNLP
jgi:DNA-binding transcriptional LysR family regulator